MLELQKIFLIVRFFNWISCNKNLKAKISCFFSCFFCLTPLRLECSGPKICIHGASRMGQKCGKCWKSPIFLREIASFFQLFEWNENSQSVCFITLPYSSTFYSLFLSFFVLEVFKFKYNKFFVRHSASISKFEWFEQPWSI